MDDPETANLADGDDTSTDIEAIDTGADEEEDQELNDLDAEDPDNLPETVESEEEFEEIERDGKKAKVPAWLKPELMMQQDYTRKTMELSEARRAFEAERQSMQQADEREFTARGNLSLIDRQIAAFEKVDWNALHEADPFEHQKRFAQFQLLKDARTKTVGYLGSLQQERTQKAQQEAATRLQEGAAELARDIPDWSPETGAKLIDFGVKHYGFSKEDFEEVDDPRLVKVLHAAYRWEEHQQKAAKAAKHTKAQGSQPAVTVRGGSSQPIRPDTKDFAKFEKLVSKSAR